MSRVWKGAMSTQRTAKVENMWTEVRRFQDGRGGPFIMSLTLSSFTVRRIKTRQNLNQPYGQYVNVFRRDHRDMETRRFISDEGSLELPLEVNVTQSPTSHTRPCARHVAWSAGKSRYVMVKLEEPMNYPHVLLFWCTAIFFFFFVFWGVFWDVEVVEDSSRGFFDDRCWYLA